MDTAEIYNTRVQDYAFAKTSAQRNFRSMVIWLRYMKPRYMFRRAAAEVKIKYATKQARTHPKAGTWTLDIHGILGTDRQ